MRFFRGFKPAVCWMFLIGVLGLDQAGTAAQLATPESRGAGVGAIIELDAQELRWVAEHPQVIVSSVQYPLYLFKDEHGQWSGLNNDLLNRISAMTGLQFVHEESFSTDQLLGRLESAEADMSTTLAMNDERKAFLDFSHAFGGAGWVFVGRADAPVVHSLAQLAKRVLVLPARHALEGTIRRDYPAIELRTVKTYAEARALVESGEAFATIENEIGAQLYPLGQLKVGRAVEGKWEADHLAVRKGQSPLLSILNKALEAFPAADLRAIRLKWLSGIAPVESPSRWRQLTHWFCWGMFIVSLFGLLSLLWNRRLAALIKQRADAEKGLGDQLAFQHALIDAMPDPMFVRDLQGRLIMCNKSYEESLCTRFDQVQGRRLVELDVLPAETAALLHAEFMAQMETRKPRFSERQLLFNNGVRDIYQWTVPFYSVDGQLRGLLGGWTDIGHRTRHL
ncbi:MAG: transporter substrate-binding domain-containing protein [Pseudomonas mandelii]|uniref:Transporter substrate-binding domain-containing protein n=1 Tax=Pseudomonas mandelii TaxID=75612 RepID=A0AB36CQK4_9PSED|nr:MULTISPECIES: transporter substrate-binding domain-containing protein [Pseudomonas]MBU0523349.1 transporter substrate-binding domain-containing protein [Gammaproteobacteria bacterium]MDF9882865.1 two-component system sensor histidine kinase EvgS [Pseudomonas silensiensis]MBA4363384.1 PAS domain-containing protein [Pseudomonas sp.]MBU0819779.1 transporter substrate-binding domain-containing protein [Gammaproteobacteria bacterium]MBU0842153.1 transporter substrate-binding domain-containing pr